MKGVLCDKGKLTYSLDVPPPKLSDGQVLISVKATGECSMAALYTCLGSVDNLSVPMGCWLKPVPQVCVRHAALAAVQVIWISQNLDQPTLTFATVPCVQP